MPYNRNEMVWAFINLPACQITEKAIGFGSYIGNIDFWLPLSQIECFCAGTSSEDLKDVDEVEIGNFISAVEIPRWLANDKDLEIDE